MEYDSLTINCPLRWLYIDLNSYFASVEQQCAPELRGRPVIVTPADTDYTCAIAASYEAKAYGIRTGTMVRDAKMMCNDLAIVSARHGRYVEFHHKIVEEVWRHIPVTQICSIDEMACRLLDNENDPEHALALGARIKAGIRRNVGEVLGSSVGIGSSKLIAKLASNMQKPDGLTLVQAHELPARLHSLKLQDITGIGRNMNRRLMRHGIYTTAQFLALRPDQARKLWGGVLGERLWYALHGVDVPDIATQPRSIGHSNVLSPENRSMAAARAVARRLAQKAASRLRRNGYCTKRVMLHVRPLNPPSWCEALAVPSTQDTFTILAAVDRLWEAMAQCLAYTMPQPRLLRLGVVLLDIVPQEAAQASLFEPHPMAEPPRNQRLSFALDTLNTRFGRNAVSIGEIFGKRPDQVGTKIAFTRIPDMQEFHE
jgi:DNA polymerase IV